MPASELHADTIAEENASASPNASDDKITIGDDGVEFQLVGENGEVIMRSNRETIDDAARQTMTMDEIEELKREGTGAGKALIAKLMASHLGIEQKTAFSLAKYKLLKTKKYLRRFTILPLDVPMLTEWVMEEKDAGKILEIRQEMLALVGSWANVHFAEGMEPLEEATKIPDGSVAQEILTATATPLISDVSTTESTSAAATFKEPSTEPSKTNLAITAPKLSITGEAPTITSIPTALSSDLTSNPPKSIPGRRYLVIDEAGGLIVSALAERMGILYPPPSSLSEPSPVPPTTTTSKYTPSDPLLATSNTITLIHQNAQPNLSLLKYFNYDPVSPSQPSSHPLSTHLHPISWLQLLRPELDTTYSTPVPVLSLEELQAMKGGKRGTYYRKLRRHNRVKEIVDSTLMGGFDALIVASTMDPISILRPLIPLLRGGATISIYSPTIEPLVALADVYSTSRRTAFIQSPPEDSTLASGEGDNEKWSGNEDFPLNPTLVINTNVQTARVREWQVLPGRTHPVMTGRGGAEGYLFTAVRVVPARGGRVEARGKWGKKREIVVKTEGGGDAIMQEGVEGENAPSPSKKRKVEIETRVQEGLDS